MLGVVVVVYDEAGEIRRNTLKRSKLDKIE